MGRTNSSTPKQPELPSQPDVIDAFKEINPTALEHPADPSPPNEETNEPSSSISHTTLDQQTEPTPEPSFLNPETTPTRATATTSVDKEGTDNPDNGTGAECGGGAPSSAETNSAWHSVDLSADSSTDRARRIEEQTRYAGAWCWDPNSDEPF